MASKKKKANNSGKAEAKKVNKNIENNSKETKKTVALENTKEKKPVNYENKKDDNVDNKSESLENKNQKNETNNENTKNNKKTETKTESSKDKKNNIKDIENNIKNNEISETEKLEKNQKKQEEIIFKNSKANKSEKSSNKKETNLNKKTAQSQEVKKEVNQKNKDKTKEIKKNLPKTNEKNKVKKTTVVIVVLIILVILLIFSVCFALIHATKSTIARGVKIKNIDVSNLTYVDAKIKVDDCLDRASKVNINLRLNDFSYIITGSEISLAFDSTDALNEAYNVGRSKSIIENNYDLVFTAISNKNLNISYTYDDDALNTIIEYVSTNIPNMVVQYSYYIDESNLIIVPGKDGIEVDKEALKNKIIEAIQNRNPLDFQDENMEQTIEIPYKNVIADKIDVEKIYNEVKCDPQNAYYVEATEGKEFEIHEDKDGVDFAISLDEAKVMLETPAEQYTIPLKITKAEVTIDKLGFEAFPYEVSTFKTSYDASNKERSTNLQIAASKINGTVITPGKQFSFNQVVGERTVSDGYKDAAVYSDGGVVQGLAGGICQVSSTLYNAALKANLQIDERHNHSFTTSYVEAGRDATVVYGIKDLKFTNTRKYPIKIEAEASNGVMTFKIYGIKEDKEYEVKILPQKTSTTPYKTQTIVDPSLAHGTQRIMQGGASGCTVVTYKEVYLNGIQVSRDQISNDTYQVMTRIIRVGP